MMQLNTTMNAQYAESMNQHQQMMMAQQMQWQHSQEEMRAREMQMEAQFEQLKLEEQAQRWQNEMKMQ